MNRVFSNIILLSIGLSIITSGFTIVGGASITSSAAETVISTERGNTLISGGVVAASDTNTNLYHSFDEFGVGEGKTARFVNDQDMEVTNIISRVTGNFTSRIDGNIHTLEFPNANLFLLNPNGVIFGGKSSLDIGGSLHISTADYLEVGGGLWSADKHAKSLLSTAPPGEFGFLGPQATGKVEIRAPLNIPAGDTLEIIAADIVVDGSDGGNIHAPEGGNIVLQADRQISIESGGFVFLEKNGQILLSGGALSVVGGPDEVSAIAAFTDQGEVGISIAMQGSINVRDNGLVQTVMADEGRDARLTLKTTDDIIVSNNSRIQFENRTANSGKIEILDFRRLELSNGGELNAFTLHHGSPSGDIHIASPSGTVIVEGGEQGISSINSSAASDGQAGQVTIETAEIHLGQESVVTTTSSGSNSLAGGINLDAEIVTLEGSKVLASSSGEGVGGTISIESPQTILTNSSISTSSSGGGDAGSIIITSSGLVHLDDESSVTTSSRQGLGNGGAISINGKGKRNLVLLTKESSIFAETAEGTGGNVVFDVQSVLKSADSTISAKAKTPIGTDGKVVFNTPDVDATTGTLELPETFFDASSMIANRCVSQASDNSSFYVGGRDGLSGSPDFLLAGYADYSDESIPLSGVTSRSVVSFSSQGATTRIVCSH